MALLKQEQTNKTSVRPHLTLVSPAKTVRTARKSFSIKTYIMSYLDSWAARISQKTFNRIMLALFGILITGAILTAGYIETIDISKL
ncbi:hypothetical protein LIS04_23 [Listeria phage LIS04]|nr:hypothetical protein LIS04_23 [Listeria phage LIS04]